MVSKIGIISDVHACPKPLKAALSIFKKQKTDAIVCAGDIAGYGNDLGNTIDLLMQCRAQTILGNHDVWLMDGPHDKDKKWVNSFLMKLPFKRKFKILNKKIYLVHASPPLSMMKGIKLLDYEGRLLSDQVKEWEVYLEPFAFDVLIVGHTHQVFAQQLGGTLVINPGSTKFNHTCAILTLPDMTVQFFPLPGKNPILAWNWQTFFSD